MNDITAIFNCSPLLYLAKIGFLPLCEKMFTKCITTPEVSKELLQKEHSPERPILEKAFNSWLEIEEANKSTKSSEFIQMGLHSGEIEVIELARKIRDQNHSEPRNKKDLLTYLVVIDDLDARDICHGLNIPITGTLGLLLLAFRNRIITKSECESFLDKLVNTTFYLSARMLTAIRQELESIE